MRRSAITPNATLLGEPLPVELMNTVGIGQHGEYDALSDELGVAAWLSAISDRLPAEAGGALDLTELDAAAVRGIAERLRRLRDSLRRLAAEVTKDPRRPIVSSMPTRETAIDTVNALARTWPELAWPPGQAPTRAFRAEGTPAELTVSLIAHQAVELFASRQRDELRACLAPGCLLYFLKQHPRRAWCSAPCGNRARVARHYRRHHAGSHPTDEVPHPRP